MKFIHCFLLLWLALLSIAGLAQNKNLVYVSLRADKSNRTNFRPVPGIGFERFLSAKSSISAGFDYRTVDDSDLAIHPPFYNPYELATVRYTVRESFLHVDLLYHQHIGQFSLALGPTLDDYLDWKLQKQVASRPDAMPNQLNFYNFKPKLLWGLCVRSAASFRLNAKLLIEPAFYYNPTFTEYNVWDNFFQFKRQFFGAQLRMGYRFGKG